MKKRLSRPKTWPEALTHKAEMKTGGEEEGRFFLSLECAHHGLMKKR
jgi:hypothetical protein